MFESASNPLRFSDAMQSSSSYRGWYLYNASMLVLYCRYPPVRLALTWNSANHALYASSQPPQCNPGTATIVMHARRAANPSAPPPAILKPANGELLCQSTQNSPPCHTHTPVAPDSRSPFLTLVPFCQSIVYRRGRVPGHRCPRILDLTKW